MDTLNARNLEYIKLQWEDIHHSRQQEWQALVVIAGIFYAIAQVDLPYPDNLGAKIFLGLIGIFSAFLGACITWQHQTIFRHKISVISRLEHQIGIQYPMRRVLLPVYVLLFLLLGGICSAFFGVTSGYVAEAFGRGELRLWAYTMGVLIFCGFFLYALFRRQEAVKVKSYGFRHPYYAEMEDLDRCLASLGNIPLKLIAGGTLSRPGVAEVVWESPQWTYHLDEELITKPVLLNRRDVFQFSLANASSKQDWHYHNSTFEVYVSDAPIDVEYDDQGADGKTQTLHVNRGVLIMPPGIPHKVSLSGHTLVFQSTLAGQGLGEDKVTVGES
ncbi:MAG: hypothetical protein H8D43_00575 [Chloroflexi bacterium]|nr:hypothetical protein [Chloroflexota bacterium]